MPTLEYRNKTWSNLDLALQLKKDVIKSLISHAGAIVGNKLRHRPPSRQQQSRFREIANNSTLLSIGGGSHEASAAPSEGSSMRDGDDRSDELPPRPSFATSGADSSYRSPSYSSGRSTNQSGIIPFRGEPEGPVVHADDSTARETPSSPLRTNGTSNSQHQGGRNRGSSLSKHLTGLGQRLRVGTDGSAEESEETTTRKSRLLLGGQKLLRSLPHRD